MSWFVADWSVAVDRSIPVDGPMAADGAIPVDGPIAADGPIAVDLSARAATSASGTRPPSGASAKPRAQSYVTGADEGPGRPSTSTVAMDQASLGATLRHASIQPCQAAS